MRRTTLILATLAAMTAAPTPAVASDPTLDRLHVYPPAIELTTMRDRQGLVVQAVYSDGITRDVTADAAFHFADDAPALLRGSTVHPAADGRTTLTVTYAGREAHAPMHVADAGADRPISFELDVMPVFTQAGCNAGACHGSAQGQDGFHLSLFGFDPDSDYFNITRQISGRRVNLASPQDSLLLTKATGTVQHTGGELMTPDSELYQTLLRWLEAGAPADSEGIPQVVGIELMPDQMVLEGEGETHRLSVLARYSDGTTRDVTTLSAFNSSNQSVAGIGEDGVITAGQRGESFVMARYDAFTVGAQVIVIPEGLQYEEPDFEPHNYIDEHIAAKLKRLRITPSELADDRTFIRRVYLDIIGQVPTPEEYEAFLADDAPLKREKLIDELLDRKEFVEMWVMQFAELLQVRSDNNVNRGLSYKATILYHNWLQRQFAENVPMDQIVRELLGSSGGTFSDPQTNFYQAERDNLLLAENVAQVFMGMRLQCAQCHNHPFDRWTMDDYYGFVGFFTQVGRKRAEDPREQIIFNSGSGEATHPVGDRQMPPKFLGGEQPDVRGRDRRQVLAEWLASPDNPYFARNLANRVWAHFFGRGIVEPVDDVRISNPPTNPQLLDALAERFTEYDYDFRKLVRDITTSRTYQLSTRANETNRFDETNFSRAYIRRLRAEVLFDTVSQVTDTTDQNKFQGLPQGASAVQIADGRISNYFLTTFGRAPRETVSSSEVCTDPNLSQALHLMNGETVHRKVQAGGLIQRMLEADESLERIVEELYIRCLSRPPTDDELARILAVVGEAGENETQAVFEDLFWALLNTKEFLFNR